MKNSFKFMAILILAAIMIAFNESRTITGRVLNNSGKPLAGVTVMVKGTKDGTITDINGSYKITVQQQGKVLVFAFIGYLTVEEKIGDRNIINIVMKKDL